MSSRLSLAIIAPEASAWNMVELGVIVDGRDVVGAVFDQGPRKDPDDLLGPGSPLLPGDRPHEVRLAVAACAEECHGALYTRIRRDGDQVVWDRWRNPKAAHVALPVFRFEVQQYETELTRAHDDRGWEWPGWTVARLLRHALTREPAVLRDWNSSLDFVACSPVERGFVRVVFTSPPKTVLIEFARLFNHSLGYRQFRLRIPVTDAPPAVQAAQALALLRAGDPRDSAEICGRGGEWPPRRPRTDPTGTREPDR